MGTQLSAQLGEGGAPKVVLTVAKHLRHAVNDITVGNLGGCGELTSEFTDLDISVVSTLHTTYDDRSAPARSLNLLTSLLLNTNVSVSNAVTASLPASFGIGANSEIIHNCVDTKDLRTKGDVPWEDVAWNEGISQDQPIIATISRFDPKNRKADLVWALPSIQEEFPDAAVVPTGWREHRRHVERVVGSLRVEDDVFFVGHVQDPYSVYYHADVVAVPSVSEGFSIGMLGAMTFAKPIVATGISPFREALGAEYQLVPPSYPPKLADAIRQYLRDPTQARRTGEGQRTPRTELLREGRGSGVSPDVQRRLFLTGCSNGRSRTKRHEHSLQ